MRAGVLITNGGPHSSEAWAVATAELIFPLDKIADSDRKIAAIRAQAAVAEALMPHHDNVQARERGHLATDAHARMGAGHDDVAEHADAAMRAIKAAIADTPWADHFDQNEDAVRQTIEHHFATAQHIERSWHADRNPGTDAAEAFRARQRGA